MALSQGATGMLAAHSHAITTATFASACVPASVGTTVAAAYPTSDLAIYVPLRVKHRVVVVKLHAAIATASGNVDIGLYDATGTRLVSAGSTAAATGLVIDVADTTIGLGLYYVAFVSDNTTLTMARDNDAQPLPATYGVLTEQLGAGGTLPATATWIVPQTLAYYPGLALLLETTVA